jgi:hypothetical protein
MIRITVDGRVAVTTEQAAAKHSLAVSTVRSIIARAPLGPIAKLDGRKNLYLSSEIDAAIKARPGRGANLRRKRKVIE